MPAPIAAPASLALLDGRRLDCALIEEAARAVARMIAQRMDTLHIYVQLAQQDLAAAQRSASPVDRWRL